MKTQHVIALLQALEDCAGFLLPENTLFAEVCNRLPKPITRTEFNAVLSDQEQKRRVVAMRAEDQSLKWRITDNGQSRLAELL